MADRYRPLFKLDAGGMAEVWVAEAESMAGFKKKVAIKRILPGLLKDERFVRMFLDEARLALHLTHANIVSVFDIGKAGATYFIVMEYVEGCNLKTILQHFTRRRVVPPVHMTVWILNEVLKGLDYAHRLRDPETGRQLGIVHRDISPPNVLLSWSGEVKLTDFGLAKASTQLESTDPGVVKGKFAYLAPEAVEGKEIDMRADVFAVGIIAWEMLTGRRLFLGESDYQTVENVRKAIVPSLSAINPEVPHELERIILRALHKEPAARFQNAGEFADDLLNFLFSRSLKVSTRDLSTLLEEIRKAEPRRETAASSSNRILGLINEEFTHFRSLGQESEDSPDTGSVPLDTLMGGAVDYSPSAPLRLDDFGEPDVGEESPKQERGRASAREPSGQPTSRRQSPAPKKESSMTPWVLLALLLAAGGGAYYWLVVLGNLDRFTG